ncbi:hypothetical protein K504DRAFT_457321 [Pleomassaria siparia CBS 279.74]|uniref:Uncharacterized protein n=1 Tax=Pleomassaria siparia CBS 279.74 TaxID=1314801 RepID=A0A6G1KRB0_9PLEO|nr:hypothetical protein K504DRAFT_457321 [Pleomassaria siparia CBS 279.74]
MTDLNPEIFPLFTDTYPMTKTMRAELACVILFTIFGMISQLKLWKIVKERREKSAETRLERDQQAAREEEARGQKIEASFTKERAQWEAIYGDKAKQRDSAVESSTDGTWKTSIGIKEKMTLAHDGVETIPLFRRSATGSNVTVSVLPEDEIHRIDDRGKLLPPNKTSSSKGAALDNRTSVGASSDGMAPNGLPRSFSTRSSLQPSAPPPPVVVPLPFRIPPYEDEATSEHGDDDSVSAAPESARESLSISRRFSTSRNSSRNFYSEELVMVPHIEDDHSSLAATLDESDEGLSLPALSPPQSPRHSILDSDAPIASKEDDRGSLPSRWMKSGTRSVSGWQTGHLHDALPEKLSKVALSYRTNEWAKHLEAAERPEADDVTEATSPGIKLDHSPGEGAVRIGDEMLRPLEVAKMKSSSKRVSTESQVYGNSNTVLAKREPLVRNGVSSQSLATTTSCPNACSVGIDQEKISLAEPRRILQQQKPRLASQQWRRSSHGALPGQSQDFNSHQPKRTCGSGLEAGKREVLLAGWRESIQTPPPPPPPPTTGVIDDAEARAAMMDERRKKEKRIQQRELAKQQRDSMMDKMMRSGGMLEAHRDAMRRMQASANLKL